jgi:hypothetical protein
LQKSLITFLAAPQTSRLKVSQEEEADAVASELLRRAGLRTDSGIAWLQRISLLEEESASGWLNAINSIVCSTHPDALQRMQNLQRNLSCLQFQSQLCEKHVTFQLSKRLEQIRIDVTKAQQYFEHTNAIAEGRLKPNDGRTQIVEIKPNPKDAAVLVNGLSVRAGRLTLPTGRHVLTATREGFIPGQVTFAVFPDVPNAKIKFRLKKCDKGKPCDSQLPGESPIEADMPSEASTIPSETTPERPNLDPKLPLTKPQK